MRKAAFILILTALNLCGAVHAQAATQRECLKEINLGKDYEEERKQAFAVFQRERSEKLRCDFLAKTSRYVSQVAKAASTCQAHEPELAKKLKSDAASASEELNSSKYKCNLRSKAELQAEKRCLSAREATNAKDPVFKKALAEYNADKTKRTQCAFLSASFAYFTEVDRMLRLCEPIYEPGGPSRVPETQTRLQQIKDNQKKFCN
jgi:hypothetical protein